jgi:hypothetical protein
MGQPARRHTIKLGPIGPWIPPRSEVIVFQPEQAAECLEEFNTRNRGFQRGVIERVKHALIVGDWILNGETIIFSSDGVLLDGQNRLKACALAGLPLSSWVVFGADPESFKTIDRGKNRGLGDDFSIRGEKNYNLLAATVRLISGYSQGGRSQTILSSQQTSQEMIDYLEERPTIRESVHFAAIHGKKMPVPTRITAALHYLFGLKHSTLRDEFFTKFHSGADMEPGDPVLALRNRLFQERIATPTSIRGGNPAHHSAFLVFYALVASWNAVRRQKPMAKMQLPTRDPSGGFTAKLPEIE